MTVTTEQTTGARGELFSAALVVARAGLSDAFGHLSVRVAARRIRLTPPVPLGLLDRDFEPVDVELGATELPSGAPREAWMHLALAESGAAAVCRAQPPAVAAFAALGRPLPVLVGHTAMLGPVAVHPDSRLIRSREAADALARSAGSATTIILRGNGAITTGATLAHAVARMWLLERAADTALLALAAGDPQELPADEQTFWLHRSDELLPRIYDYLLKNYGRNPQ